MLSLGATGIPWSQQGWGLGFSGPGGESLSVLLGRGCGGEATMGVFLSILALMLLDAPPSRGRVVALFLLGAVGTWLQNIVRILAIIGAGHLLGRGAMEAVHTYASYVVFPLWYALFGFIYFRWGRRKGKL